MAEKSRGVIRQNLRVAQNKVREVRENEFNEQIGNELDAAIGAIERAIMAMEARENEAMRKAFGRAD